jgi:molybdopterin-containing oxidoreductase family iron-sulfur binding subunit
VHDEEGINVMAYNRCIGTRYCANNCPYKVRRFNYFDFNQRPLDQLRWGPFAKKGMAETLQLSKNPNVTVRMRGVMEKCTFCVQRIQRGKRDAAAENRPLADGEIQPACVQSCPAEAMVFGDLNDPESRVSKLAGSGRSTQLLGELGTKPKVFYLERAK